MEKDGKRLQDEVVALKAAIEEAIIKRQKSVDGLDDVHWSGPFSRKKSAPTHVNAGSRVAARLADF